MSGKQLSEWENPKVGVHCSGGVSYQLASAVEKEGVGSQNWIGFAIFTVQLS